MELDVSFPVFNQWSNTRDWSYKSFILNPRTRLGMCGQLRAPSGLTAWKEGGSHIIGNWGDSEVGLDIWMQRRIPFFRESTQDSSSITLISQSLQRKTGEEEMRWGIFFRDNKRETRRCVVNKFNGKSGGEKAVRKGRLGNVRKAGVGKYTVSVERHYIKQHTLMVDTEGCIPKL